MKFYLSMVCVLVLDVLTFWILTRFYVPVPGTAAFALFKYLFFCPFVLVSAIQLCKLLVNIRNGYVVTGSGFRLVKWSLDTNPVMFLLGIGFELLIWGILGMSVLQFLLRTH